MADQQQPKPAGWKRDPTGRHYGRWWDGAQWTDTVISAEKVQGVDPLVSRPEPSIFNDGPAPAPSQRRAKDGGVKVWKIALGVMLGIFAVIGACLAVIGGAANQVSNDLESKPAVVRIEAEPSVCWSGSIGDATRDGCGPASYDVETIVGNLVSANVQKRDGGPGQLSIVIEVEGKEVARNSTTAAYGVASATSS